MNQLNEQQLRTHVPTASWLLIANSLLGLVLSLFLFTLMASAGALFTEAIPTGNDPEAAHMLSWMASYNTFMATLISGLVAGLSIPGLIAGAGMLARKSWARVLGIVVSVLTLINFPVGTLIGGYAIFVLMQDAATSYFASPPSHFQAAQGPA